MLALGPQSWRQTVTAVGCGAPEVAGTVLPGEGREMGGLHRSRSRAALSGEDTPGRGPSKSKAWAPPDDRDEGNSWSALGDRGAQSDLGWDWLKDLR